MKKFSLLVFCLFFLKGSLLFAQQRKDSKISEKEVVSEKKNTKASTSVNVSKVKKNNSDEYRLLGAEIENKLISPSPQSDYELGGQEFIIERSPAIKIEYVPSPAKTGKLIESSN